MPPKRPPGRSTLPRDEARRRYVDIGQLAALEQIKRDSERLDRRSAAVGPFARLDADAVAARDGKTRGVITHLFGSQAAFQAETMALALHAAEWVERSRLPGARRSSRTPAPGSTPSSRASLRAGRAMAAGRRWTTRRCGRCG